MPKPLLVQLLLEFQLLPRARIVFLITPIPASLPHAFIQNQPVKPGSESQEQTGLLFDEYNKCLPPIVENGNLP